MEPEVVQEKYVKCEGCHIKPITQERYTCNQCFDFNFCLGCYNKYKLQKFPLNLPYQTNHTLTHNFEKFLQSNKVPEARVKTKDIS
jgi:hypothetical protein